MLTDAARYMEALEEIDKLKDALEDAIFDPRTPDERCRDLRLRRKQLADVRALITGGTRTLPHS